jgi:anti-sigma regulatory factor (Ser/Thr protein kinase)
MTEREIVTPIATREDRFTAARAARHIAATAGFPLRVCEELAIVASELASNILKYGMRGDVRVTAFHDVARGVGVRIAANDEGPPFLNLELALRDVFDDKGPIDPGKLLHRRGLGSGLGAVVRLTDSFHCEERPRGKTIVVVRYLAGGRPRLGG